MCVVGNTVIYPMPIQQRPYYQPIIIIIIIYPPPTKSSLTPCLFNDRPSFGADSISMSNDGPDEDLATTTFDPAKNERVANNKQTRPINNNEK